MLCAQHRGDKQLVKRKALYAERVGEVACNLVEQTGSARHQIGCAVAEVVHAIERIVAHIDQSALLVLRRLPVGYAADAQPLGRGQLHIVEVGEASLVVAHAAHSVLHRLAVGVGEPYRFAWRREQAVNALTVGNDGIGRATFEGFVTDVAAIRTCTTADEAAQQQCSQGQLEI